MGYRLIGRFAITNLSPHLYFGGQLIPSKGYLGEWIPIGANVTREGHDALRVKTLVFDSKGELKEELLMREIWPGTDRYEAWFSPDSTGIWSYQIIAEDDEIETWLHDASIKISANIESELMCEIGKNIFEKVLANNEVSENEKKSIKKILEILGKSNLLPIEKFNSSKEILSGLDYWKYQTNNISAVSEKNEISVEPVLNGFSSWYEFFPRSEGAYADANGKIVSGNFQTAIKSLTRVADMGFDILYIPPIHPIGKSFRKGKNNSLTATNNDPGVPWAIGSIEGGHKDINPELGTLSDFKDFITAADKLNIKIAMDLALQASPDHPWVKAHPDFFTTRPDGSIAYAENPPKKYQDIYPINFDLKFEELVSEVYSILEYWIKVGVKIFRVDNPHTKPINFWQQVIAKVKASSPEVIFLAEAFTRPTMMNDLAKAGFTSSYTYFTWRVSKNEIQDYCTQLAKQDSHFFRPNFWVNTPDILPFHLQNASENIFKMRAMLAATLSPQWGMYAGYELRENLPIKEGAEEYLDSEKYEIKIRNFPENILENNLIAKFVAQLNLIRKKYSAFAQMRTLEFHQCDNPNLLVFSKSDGNQKIIVAINLNANYSESGYVKFNTFYLNQKSEFKVTELFSQTTMIFQENQFLEIRDTAAVGHIYLVN